MTGARLTAAAGALAALLLAATTRGQDAPRSDDTAACASAYEDAQVQQKQGHLVAALGAAMTCARPSCPAVARKDCEGWAAEIAREVPTVVVIARDEATGEERSARVLVDGKVRDEAAKGRAFELDPGDHVFRVEVTGAPPVEQTIAIFQGEKNRALRFALHREKPAAPAAEARGGVTYLPAILVGGAAAAVLGVSAWLGVTGRNDLSQLRTTCAPGCTDDQVGPVREKLVVSDIALGVGLAGALAALYLVLRPPATTPPPPALPRFDVAPVAGGATVSAAARF